MNELSLVILNEDLQKVNETIIKHGCLHPFKIDMLGDWAKKLDGFSTASSLEEHRGIEKKIDALCAKVNVDLDYDPSKFESIKDQIEKFKADDIFRQIIDFEIQIKSIDDKNTQLDEQLLTAQDINSRYNMFRDIIGLPKNQSFTILEQVTGKIPSANLNSLQDGLSNHPHLLIPVRQAEPWTIIILYTLKRETISIKKLLEKINFQAVSLEAELQGSPEQILDKLNKNIDRLKKEKIELQEKKKKLYETIKSNIVMYGYYVHYNSLLLKSQTYFKKTSKTCIITGWVPGDNLHDLLADIKKVTNNRCYYSVKNPVEDQKDYNKIPFKFKNNKLVQPFELLIKAYGIPNYAAINPTPFFALTFLLMFGFMFADVGHGAILLACGLYFLLKKSFKSTIKQVGLLLVLCGSSAVVFGFMFGSIFGNEELIHPVWLHPMHNIDTMLKISLFFGITMISGGIIINVINFIITKKWSEAIFNKTGLVSGLIYWGLIGLIVKTLVFKHTVPGWLWLLVVGLPIIILFFKAPFEKITGSQSHHEEGVFAYLMDTVFEIVEIFMAYIANTFSFIRVGAFALSHVGLFFAIFSLAEMLRQGSLGGVWATIIIILGNILVLVLEGMIVTIQTIRLEYYEFFSKFFPGEGTLYKPLSIKDK